jgi:uncharacterized membrane protein
MTRRAQPARFGETRNASANAEPRRPHRRGVDAPSSRGASARVPARMARIASIDALRGVAIIAMIVYHLCFDLRHFGLVRWDFEHDPAWLAARTVILSSFLLLAGVSAVLARGEPRADARWLKRIATIGVAALAVTAASAVAFPQTFIWFGVLHAIAVALLIARPLIDRPWLSACTGIAIVVAGSTWQHPAFDNRALGWIGFMTMKPSTEDYVQLFPWAGTLFIGIAVGHWLVRSRFAPVAPMARAPSALHWMGRHSLALYLVHQPVLLGLLWLALRR